MDFNKFIPAAFLAIGVLIAVAGVFNNAIIAGFVAGVTLLILNLIPFFHFTGKEPEVTKRRHAK